MTIARPVHDRLPIARRQAEASRRAFNRRRGTAPVEEHDHDQDDQDDQEDIPRAEPVHKSGSWAWFKSAVNARIREGASRKDAIRAVSNEHPDRASAAVDDYNKKRDQKKATDKAAMKQFYATRKQRHEDGPSKFLE
jgi:hypothetical protein